MTLRTDPANARLATGLPRPRRRMLGALLVGLLLLLPAVPASAAGRSIDGCGYASARVLGALWADGKHVTPSNGGDSYFFYRTLSPRIADHMTRNLDRLDLAYGTGRSIKGHYNFRIFIDNIGGELLSIEPSSYVHTRCHKKAFLASVIESEGNKNGKVMDDPKAQRRGAIQRLLTKRNIGSTQAGQAVNARQADWPKFQTLPFVACGRVPGGKANCDLSLAPGN